MVATILGQAQHFRDFVTYLIIDNSFDARRVGDLSLHLMPQPQQHCALQQAILVALLQRSPQRPQSMWVGVGGGLGGPPPTCTVILLATYPLLLTSVTGQRCTVEYMRYQEYFSREVNH